MPRSWLGRLSSVLFAVLVGPAAPVLGEGVDLDIHKLALDGGEVEFHQTHRAAVLPAEVDLATLSCGSAGVAKVCVDQGHIAPNEFREFDYVFIVFRGSSNPIRFKFLATSTGKFVDHLDTLHFDMSVDGAPVQGTLRSPIYCNAQMDLLTVDSVSRPHPVKLSGETPIPLHINSRAQDLDILLVDQAAVSCDPSLWMRCEARFLNLRKLGQGLHALPLSPNLPALEIRVVPVPLQALTASLLPFKRSAPAKDAAE